MVAAILSVIIRESSLITLERVVPGRFQITSRYGKSGFTTALASAVETVERIGPAGFEPAGFYLDPSLGATTTAWSAASTATAAGTSATGATASASSRTPTGRCH